MIYLSNSARILTRGKARILIGGVPDYMAQVLEPENAPQPKKILAETPPPRADLNILLAHQPKMAYEASSAGFDLQLSGHTHGGQFVPWTFIIYFVQPFVSGLRHVGRMRLYVSRGTGYWGPAIRLGSPSEVTLLTLTRA